MGEGAGALKEDGSKKRDTMQGSPQLGKGSRKNLRGMQRDHGGRSSEVPRYNNALKKSYEYIEETDGGFDCSNRNNHHICQCEVGGGVR